ncbi:MAG: hypothetical protein AAB019_07875, partial [Planctomycetota bacterium]
SSAGATPSLGKQIGEQRKTTAYGQNDAYKNFKWFEAFVKMNVPQYKLELRAGYLNTDFIQDYGKELFWHEEMNGNKFSLYVGSWHDTGIEAYRSFELPDLNMSLPVSVYLLNGTGGTTYLDNNRNKTLLLHAEPEFGGKLSGLKTFISYGFGKWGDTEWDSNYAAGSPGRAKSGEQDQKYNRWSLGASYSYQKFSVRAEMAGNRWDKYFNFDTATEEDKQNAGYYVKLFYKIIPDKLTAMLDYSVARLEQSASKNEVYNTTTLGLQYELGEACTYIIQYDMADWSNDETPAATAEDTLKFNRLVMGIRTTF